MTEPFDVVSLRDFYCGDAPPALLDLRAADNSWLEIFSLLCSADLGIGSRSAHYWRLLRMAQQGRLNDFSLSWHDKLPHGGRINFRYEWKPRRKPHLSLWGRIRDRNSNCIGVTERGVKTTLSLDAPDADLLFLRYLALREWRRSRSRCERCGESLGLFNRCLGKHRHAQCTGFRPN